MADAVSASFSLVFPEALLSSEWTGASTSVRLKDPWRFLPRSVGHPGEVLVPSPDPHPETPSPTPHRHLSIQKGYLLLFIKDDRVMTHLIELNLHIQSARMELIACILNNLTLKVT